MKRDHLHESQRWLRQALQDQEDAVYVNKGKRYHLACFLAQQAAEKALKAFLYAQGAEHVWGHSVIELCADAAQFDSGFQALKKAAAWLDKYYIPTRYPNGLPGGIPSEVFQEEDGAMALEKASKIIAYIEERIG